MLYEVDPGDLIEVAKARAELGRVQTSTGRPVGSARTRSAVETSRLSRSSTNWCSVRISGMACAKWLAICPRRLLWRAAAAALRTGGVRLRRAER